MKTRLALAVLNGCMVVERYEDTKFEPHTEKCLKVNSGIFWGVNNMSEFEITLMMYDYDEKEYVKEIKVNESQLGAFSEYPIFLKVKYNGDKEAKFGYPINTYTYYCTCNNCNNIAIRTENYSSVVYLQPYYAEHYYTLNITSNESNIIVFNGRTVDSTKSKSDLGTSELYCNGNCTYTNFSFEDSNCGNNSFLENSSGMIEPIENKSIILTKDNCFKDPTNIKPIKWWRREPDYDKPYGGNPNDGNPYMLILKNAPFFVLLVIFFLLIFCCPCFACVLCCANCKERKLRSRGLID